MLDIRQIQKQRLETEIAVMSYIINYNPDSIVVTADDFVIDVIRDVFRWWTEPDYCPTRHISPEEDEIIDKCTDSDYASCGYFAYLIDCRTLRRAKWKKELER